MSNQDFKLIAHIPTENLAVFRAFCGHSPNTIVSENPSIAEDYTDVTFSTSIISFSLIRYWFNSFKINYIPEDKA